MSWRYRCPKCRAMLNPHDTIILTAAHGNTRILAGFHPEPGNYEIYFPPDIMLTQGQQWDFYCPVCQADLTSEQSDKLCALDYEHGDEKSQVLFSRIVGEQATYFVAEGAVQTSYGQDLQTYVDLCWSMRLF